MISPDAPKEPLRGNPGLLKKREITLQAECMRYDFAFHAAEDKNVRTNQRISAFSSEVKSKVIEPMLLIPFVENAFKHGMNPNKESELKIKIQVTEKLFIFEIENSFDRDFKAFYKEKGFGIGIENVRQRLQYIYPGRHTLFIHKEDDRFIVKMAIG